MSYYQTRLNQLEVSKQKFADFLKTGEIEKANQVVRDASFNCNFLGKNVIVEFSSLLQLAKDTASDVNELQEFVKTNLKCPHCDDFIGISQYSLKAHIGRKHKKNVKKTT
ncbi:hypothetical protein VB796_08785 [Arcicella sp. LKC2W]|uniref:hypothetical protein n=1 Tax=Arcicella sp. LKC2W TaxID=2984198 RepID=UPI002B1F34C5|nr:hypothetical protein [Arcicella sp. LKC2W]MEA5459130.1 hypothetical protein [Arcicella sp. LKC2W]